MKSYYIIGFIITIALIIVLVFNISSENKNYIYFSSDKSTRLLNLLEENNIDFIINEKNEILIEEHDSKKAVTCCT
nr:hypothetical protein [Paenibacillus bovis]